MAQKVLDARVKNKCATSEEWEGVPSFIPLKGEIVIYSDLNKMKVGDGETELHELPFIDAGSASHATTAGSATKATQDANGNDIASTYVPQIKYLGDGVDLNTVLTSGFYRLAGEPTNGPGGIGYGQLIVSRAGADTVAQLAFPWSVSACYIRTASGVVVSENPSWHDWRAVTFDDQFSYSDGTLTISI